MADPTLHIPAFIINLARDTERWRNISARLGSFGVPINRVPAIDARKHISLVRLLVKSDFQYAPAKRSLTNGEICCYLSHIAALKRFLRQDHEAAMIFEDDAVFADSFPSFYRQDLKAFLRTSDIVKFEGIHYQHTSKNGLAMARGETSDLIVRLRPTLGAAAYAVTRRGAQALIKALSTIDRPFDHKLVYYDRHWINYAETEPFLVRQASYTSNLEADREIRDQANLPPNPLDKARSKVESAARGMSRFAYLGKFMLSRMLPKPRTGP